MKKNLVISLMLMVLAIVLSGCRYDLKDNSVEAPVVVDPVVVESEAKIVEEVIPLNILDILQKFGYDYLNYNNFEERNARLKYYLTDEVFKEQGFDQSTTVKMVSTGNVERIYKDVANENVYMLYAIEEVNDTKNIVVIEVYINEDLKISEMSVGYVVQGMK